MLSRPVGGIYIQIQSIREDLGSSAVACAVMVLEGSVFPILVEFPKKYSRSSIAPISALDPDPRHCLRWLQPTLQVLQWSGFGPMVSSVFWRVHIGPRKQFQNWSSAGNTPD